jgi:dsDNA-specific endonuclease/ATPase MutS2
MSIDSQFSDYPNRSAPPARSIENRENQLIEKAYDVAEERLNNGTASAQEIVHFLKMGAARAQLEKQKIEAEVELLESKKQIIDANKQSSEAYQAALDAFRSYNGTADDET